MKLNLLKFIILIFILNSSNSFCYEGPTSYGFFPIGWSENGETFAYGYYIGSGITQDAVQMTIVIQNMVNDSVLFQDGKTWEQTFVGDDTDIHLPESPKDAWKQISTGINKKLKYYNIKEGNFIVNPFFEHDAFRAEIKPLKMEPGYGLYLIKQDGKQKMITDFSEELSGKTANMIQGFVWNLNKGRIAVIVLIDEEHFDIFQAIGCNMKVGFK